MEIFITRIKQDDEQDDEWVDVWHFDDTKTVAIFYKENGSFKVTYDDDLNNIRGSIEYIVIRTKNDEVNKAFETCFGFWNKFTETTETISCIYLHCNNYTIKEVFTKAKKQNAQFFEDIHNTAVKENINNFAKKFKKYSIGGGVGSESKLDEISRIINEYKLNKIDSMLIIKHKIFEPLYALAIRISFLKSGKMSKGDQHELMCIFKDPNNSERNELIKNNLHELTDLIEYLPVDETDCIKKMEYQVNSLLTNMDLFHEKLNQFDDMFDQCFSLVN